MKQIYLDYAAATPMDPSVLAAMQPYFNQQFYNPSALYLPARQVAKAVSLARSHMAHWLGVRPGELIFTAGGTEANNLAIHGIMRQFPDANICISAIEHESVLRPAGQYDHRLIPVQPDGIIDVNQLDSIVDDNTVLVSIMYANNEIGVIQPIKRIAEVIKQLVRRRLKNGNSRPLYFHTDACQAAAYLDLHTARLGVDLLTLNGGKIYGPKQSGALVVRAGINVSPLIQGGGQEYGLRSGTENVPAIMGLSVALDLVQNRRPKEVKRLKTIQKEAFNLIGRLLPEATINGSQKTRLPNNIHLTIPGTDNERLIMALDEQGICVAAGSACSASSEESSHVLAALGMSETEARSSLRLTMGRQTTVQHINLALKLIANLSKKNV